MDLLQISFVYAGRVSTTPIPEPPLDTRRLQQFVAVAEEPTLSDAAARTFVTQQALSAAIRTLERELGVELFDRSRRQLALTDAGRSLYAGARSLLAGAAGLARDVRQSAAGSPDPFVIGHSPALTGGEVYDIIGAGLDRHGDCAVTARQLFPAAFRDELLDGSVDLVLRRGVATPPGLASAIVTYHRLRVAVGIRHPLAGARGLTMPQIAPYPIMVWAPEHQSFYTDFLVAHCRRSGFEPELRVNPIQGTPPSTAVLRDDEVCAFVTEPAGPLHRGRAVVIELDPAPLVPVQALWIPHTESVFRAALLQMDS